MSGVRIANHLLACGGQRDSDQDQHARNHSCLHVFCSPARARPRHAFTTPASTVHQNAGIATEFDARPLAGLGAIVVMDSPGRAGLMRGRAAGP